LETTISFPICYRGGDALPEQKPDVNAVIAAVKRLYAITDDSLGTQSRERRLCEAGGLTAWAAVELSGGKLTELAREFGREPSTLTCAVRQIEKRHGKDPLLDEKMERLRQDLQISSCQVLTLTASLHGMGLKLAIVPETP
jgi:chromosomal replication initiation ATPase DnaA